MSKNTVDPEAMLGALLKYVTEIENGSKLLREKVELLPDDNKVVYDFLYQNSEVSRIFLLAERIKYQLLMQYEINQNK